ncbi:MAG TPA: hypothetical protein VIJ21_05345 [Solirubrobacterales bacterium]
MPSAIRHLDLIDAAAEKYNLDAQALKATAAAAMAAPLRYVTVDVYAAIAA